MTEFWEKSFQEKREMWGFQPANAALQTAALFADNGYRDILIPGIGYGRNAQVFIDKGMNVTGIEISQTAIELAKNHYGQALSIYHGSVTEMPFDNKLYNGIFCHGLIHLLDESERARLIENCYGQLSDNGCMVFTMISKKAHTYGQGIFISHDRYEQFGGVQLFFFDEVSIQKEFSNYGLVEVVEITENFPFYLIKCCKIDER